MGSSFVEKLIEWNRIELFTAAAGSFRTRKRATLRNSLNRPTMIRSSSARSGKEEEERGGSNRIHFQVKHHFSIIHERRRHYVLRFGSSSAVSGRPEARRSTLLIFITMEFST